MVADTIFNTKAVKNDFLKIRKYFFFKKKIFDKKNFYFIIGISVIWLHHSIRLDFFFLYMVGM